VAKKACQKLYTQVLLGEDSIYNTIIFLGTARKKCKKNEKLNLEMCFYISSFPTDLPKYAQEKRYAQVVISGDSWLKYRIELCKNQKNAKKKQEKSRFMA